MTRPEIIRADSIDLQDQDAPSAQDHTRQPTHPAPLGTGPPAPHQAETLREKAAAVAEEHVRSPRVSKEWTNGDNVQEEIRQYGDDLADGVAAKLTGSNLQQQDELAVAQNGGLTGSTTEDAEMADAEGDDGFDDDDMMDKISSSPSIDDGGYPFPQLWPQRSDSLERTSNGPSLVSQACSQSSSPYVETPAHFPLFSSPAACTEEVVLQADANHNHLLGEYLDGIYDESNYDDDQPEAEEISIQMTDYDQHHFGAYDAEFYSEYYATEETEPNAEDVDRELEGLLPGYKSGFDDEFVDESYDEPDDIETDELGIKIPYQASEDEQDDDYDIPYSADSRFLDSGWGGECLQELEDIDFEFVYALHTFVATVDGQANATKGDTMVLLDDSNSYWWLVRVVKDSSIGYLPAEHIETPTERLARLNKHRNIDLTSTMLGDQAEKTKNPLKKAIRRRNAKTVTFTAPTYVEASDNDYSTDEEDMDGDFFGQNGQQEQNGDEKDQRREEEEADAVEPLRPKAESRELKTEPADADATRGEATKKADSDISRTSDEWPDGKVESKSKNGTVRNTDSFFKDDTVETRKITLTPNLLRDDSSTSTRTSNDSKELKQRPSLDKLEKDTPDKKDKKDKKEKKEKEKKPGMLSGLFKRKEKKSKAVDDEVDESKRSTDNPRSSPVPSKDSEEAGPIIEEPAPAQTQEVQRQPSKLQKHPKENGSPIKKAGQTRDLVSTGQQSPAPEGSTPVDLVQSPSMRIVQPDPSEAPIEQAKSTSPEQTRGPTPVLAPLVTAPKEQKSGNAISKMLRSASHSEPKPVKAKKAKARVELDDFDSSPEDSPVEEPIRAPSKQSQRPIPGSFPDSYIGTPATERGNPTEERLSESPIQVSPVATGQSYPPALIVDTSSQEEAPSPDSSPSPELIDAEEAREKKTESTSTSTSTATSTATWNDSHLRTFFDDEGDIRDLLVVVYDKSGVVPAGPDHPITGNMFREENAKLADITNRLDGMLGDWLARKMRIQSPR